MSHYPPDTDSLCSMHDRIRVDSVVMVKVGNLSSLAEMLHPERLDAMTSDTTDPGESRRMAVEHRNNSAVA